MDRADEALRKLAAMMQKARETVAQQGRDGVTPSSDAPVESLLFTAWDALQAAIMIGAWPTACEAAVFLEHALNRLGIKYNDPSAKLN